MVGYMFFFFHGKLIDWTIGVYNEDDNEKEDFI